jgi:HD-GYP domain-containing protein (c-di-GMP phosphodiesterase class II)
MGEVLAKELVASGVLPFSKIYRIEDKTRLTGLLHDIGKIGILDRILFKKGKLTEKEFAVIKRHPISSLHIVESLKSIPEEARDGIGDHHERYDGKGYNKGIQEQRIPPIARIIAVVDAYDAMTSDRPYREARTIDEARSEINRMSGIQFDPYVVAAFNSAFDKGEIK